MIVHTGQHYDVNMPVEINRMITAMPWPIFYFMDTPTGDALENLPDQIENIFTGNVKPQTVPYLWVGHTAKRVVGAFRAI